MSTKELEAWLRRKRKLIRRWAARPVFTLPWELKPGQYLPPPAPPWTGREIAALREREGLTQNELAAFLNVTVKAVQAWEQDLRTPEGPVDRVLQILDEVGKIFFHGMCKQGGRSKDEGQGTK